MLKLVKMNRTSIVFMMLVVVLVLGSVYNSFMTIEPIKFNIYDINNKYVWDSMTLSESDMMLGYINDPSVGRIEVTSPKSEGAKFYNKLLNKKAKIGSGALALGTLDGELYFLDDGTPIIFGNEMLMKISQDALKNWKKLDGRKFPMGVIIDDDKMGLPSYGGEDEVDRYFGYVSYPIFVKNMERGYIDTSYHTIRYPDEGMMYKFLDIYNATKAIPNNKDMMKVYNKIVEKGKQNQRYYIDMYVYSGIMGTWSQEKELSREFDIYAYLFKMNRSDLQKLIKECGGVIVPLKNKKTNITPIKPVNTLRKVS